MTRQTARKSIQHKLRSGDAAHRTHTLSPRLFSPESNEIPKARSFDVTEGALQPGRYLQACGEPIMMWKDDGKLIGTVHPNTKLATKVFRESLGYSVKYVRNNCEHTVYGCTAHVDCPVLIAQYHHGPSAQFWQVICVGAPPPKPPPTLHPARLQTSMHGRDPSSLQGWMPRQRGRSGGCYSETLHVSSSLKTQP